jgi:putative transcriptional regulator
MSPAPQYLSGRILLALPGMFDPRFVHAVIAMCVHDEKGALGIDVSRQHESLRFRAVLEEAGVPPGEAPDVPVHVGGPVEPQRGFVLHSTDWGGHGTIHVGKLWALSFSTDVLRAIAEGRGPSKWLFALGYTGWGQGQLEGELRHHGWHAASGHGEVLFDPAPDQRWKAAWRAEGIDPALLASETGRA